MKINNLSLPHPVLGVGDDVRGSYNADLQVELDTEKISLRINQSIFNRTLKSLIESKKAAFAVEVNCSQTFYRKSFLRNEDNYVIEIPSVELRNRVLVNFYITAEQDISDYQIDESNEDYNGYKFDITKGDVLAYGGFTSFNAPKDWQALIAVTSFMQIQEYDKPEGPVQFVLTQDKVVIQMSKNDYKRYSEYKEARNLYPIFHGSFVFAALLHVLYSMHASKEEYSDMDWYQTLEERFETEEKFKGLDINQISHIPEIAQRLLDNPVYRELVGMKNIIETAGQEE